MSFVDLRDRALEELKDGSFSFVCGPITTGGLGDRDKNLARFQEVIDELSKTVKIWSQMPYEDEIYALANAWRAKGNTGYCEAILTDFYLPVFQSGLITDAYFMPDWETSHGATYEHEIFTGLGVRIHYL